jgi:hypothetical protein
VLKILEIRNPFAWNKKNSVLGTNNAMLGIQKPHVPNSLK